MLDFIHSLNPVQFKLIIGLFVIVISYLSLSLLYLLFGFFSRCMNNLVLYIKNCTGYSSTSNTESRTFNTDSTRDSYDNPSKISNPIKRKRNDSDDGEDNNDNNNKKNKLTDKIIINGVSIADILLLLYQLRLLLLDLNGFVENSSILNWNVLDQIIIRAYHWNNVFATVFERIVERFPSYTEVPSPRDYLSRFLFHYRALRDIFRGVSRCFGNASDYVMSERDFFPQFIHGWYDVEYYHTITHPYYDLRRLRCLGPLGYSREIWEPWDTIPYYNAQDHINTVDNLIRLLEALLGFFI